MLLSRYTVLYSTVPPRVESIQASGLDLRPLRGAYSEIPPFSKLYFTCLTFHRALSHEYPGTGLKVYINGDGVDVYEDSFCSLAKGDDGCFTPTLILVGIRLGIDRVTPAYWEALKASLQLSQSVGIAGGRPSSSHYFFGVQGDQFFYLDPHITRPALRLHSNSAELTNEEVASCHTRRLRRLALGDMDPSMLIAFLIQDEDDWREWRKAVSEAPGKPVINIADTEPLLHIQGAVRQNAVDDVETFDEDGEGDGELIERPQRPVTP